MDIPHNAITADEYREAVAIKAQIAQLTEALAVLTTSLAATGAGMHNIDGGGSFTVSENNTYPEAAIRSGLSEGQAKRCEVRKMDNALVKVLYPAVYASAKKTNGFKVTIR